jgi:hypothetical protein
VDVVDHTFLVEDVDHRGLNHKGHTGLEVRWVKVFAIGREGMILVRVDELVGFHVVVVVVVVNEVVVVAYYVLLQIPWF